MEFHPDKCEVLTVTNKRTPVIFPYHLHDIQLKRCKEAKYLGVTFASDLTFCKHITNITSKANKSLGFLKRNIQISSPDLKSTAYTTLVRPLLEFAPTIWDPYPSGKRPQQNPYRTYEPSKYSDQLEMIQRRAARYVLHRYHNTSSVTEMLQKLNWVSLQERRRQCRLVMFYKLHHHLVHVITPGFLVPVSRSTHRGHPFTYYRPNVRLQSTQFSFYHRTIPEWNALPQHVVEAPSLDSFKSRLISGASRHV